MVWPTISAMAAASSFVGEGGISAGNACAASGLVRLGHTPAAAVQVALFKKVRRVIFFTV